MRYKVDENTIERLAIAVEKFEDKLSSEKQGWEESCRTSKRIDELSRDKTRLESELNTIRSWKDSLEAKELVARKEELDSQEKELTKKRKEIEDLAYNKGYVAGYVEITQKLGKS